MSEKKTPTPQIDPQWQKQDAPQIFNKLEGILHLAAWCVKQEMKRQEKKAEKIKEVFETQLKEEAGKWRNGNR